MAYLEFTYEILRTDDKYFGFDLGLFFLSIYF